MKTSIILITCYFGEFPWYFNLFLKSCRYNTTVDFIIFSDCFTDSRLPDNVKIVPFTIEAFNDLATKKLNFKVNLRYAYKLCDLKPAYGIIFSDYIQGYDLWGMTDIDIVFGRIREFMTDELLKKYDVISVRNDYPTGSFMLFRNEEIPNNLFKKSKDYKKIFQSDVHYCFDECNFKHGFLQEGGNIDDLECDIESMHHVILKEVEKNNIKAHFDFLIIEGLPGQLKWDKGLLSFKNEFEVLLYHLILYKSNTFTIKKAFKVVPDTFFIDKYVIRQSKLNTLKGLLVNLYHNKLLPSFSKSLFKMDFLISNKLNFSVKGLKTNTYGLNDIFYHIFENNSKENLISLGRTKVKRELIKSFFYSGSFYIKNLPFIRYSIETKGQRIIALSMNGNISMFDKKN